MTCKQCQATTPDDAAFCHKCGAALGNLAADLTARQRFGMALARGDGGDEPEKILWQGRFSKRAMIGSWISAGVFTLALLALAVAAGFSGKAWLVTTGALAATWLGLLILLLYRQVSVHYYLTNQRILHERGLLWREIDRIEAIDVDDVSFTQGPVERLLGIGTVRIRSSDVSTPTFEIAGIEDVRNLATMIDEVRRAERRRRGLHIESV
ncbi:MAG: PH domain-containing protein [Pirellulales bacterium]|nr:PH domain-containing protein [Pirellulales bacterium]